MAKTKAKGKSGKKAKNVKKRELSAAEITRAQKRLSKAISEVEAAKLKVERRERDLEAALNRHGLTPEADENVVAIADAVVGEATDDVSEDLPIALAAPVQQDA